MSEEDDDRDRRVLPGSGVPFEISFVQPPPGPRLVREPFGSPYTQDELDDAQDRLGLAFPPDLIALLREHRLTDGWDYTDPNVLREGFDWVYRGLLFDVENWLWWPEWGQRPTIKVRRAERLREVLESTPPLIPLLGHRFLPATPCEAGNPVFSIMQSDIVYYGADLEEWVHCDVLLEARPGDGVREPRWIEFWSEMVLRARCNTREAADAAGAGHDRWLRIMAQVRAEFGEPKTEAQMDAYARRLAELLAAEDD